MTKASFEVAVGQLRAVLESLCDAAIPLIDQATKAPYSTYDAPAEGPDPRDIEYRWDAILECCSELPDLSNAKALIQASPGLKAKVQPLQRQEDGDKYASFDRFLLAPAARAVHLTRSGEEPHVARAGAIEALVDCLHCKRKPVRFLCTLPGLGLDGKTITLDAAHAIRPATADEYYRLHDDRLLTTLRRRGEHIAVPLLAADGYTQPAEGISMFPSVSAEVRRDVDSVICFVQLFLHDGLRPQRLMVVNKEWYPTVYGGVAPAHSSRVLYPEAPFWAPVPGVTVTDEHVKTLPVEWGHFRSALGNKRFRVAAFRFAQVPSRAYSEDALVDSCICLEALLSTADREVTDLVSLRYSLVAAKGLEGRRDARAQIKALYAIRSAVVHGGEPADRLRRFWETLPKEFHRHSPSVDAAAVVARWLVSRCLHVFLSRPDMIDEFDDLMLSVTFPPLPPLLDLLARRQRDPRTGESGASKSD